MLYDRAFMFRPIWIARVSTWERNKRFESSLSSPAVLLRPEGGLMGLGALKSHLEAAKKAVEDALANVDAAAMNPHLQDRALLRQASKEVLEAQRDLTEANKVLLPYARDQ